MGSASEIKCVVGDSVVDLALETIGRNKQALVFVNTKRSAEKCAEDISRAFKHQTSETAVLSEKALNALSKPTKQCERLSKCLKSGIAFHHAGLASSQKELVEDAFRAGSVKIICCTPTLAAGLDLPAFRVVIRDVKRYSEHGGMNYIPVLEYLQMAGRAGRPKFDTYGEAVVIAPSEPDKGAIYEKYILGTPEEIYSKLAVEPVLRTYLLSLTAGRIVRSREEIVSFFSKTFWAHQYKDMERMGEIIDKMLNLLVKWGFLQSLDKEYRATFLGKRIAELYVDPLTAYRFVECVTRAKKPINTIAFLQAVSNTLEMRPLLRVKTKEFDDMQQKTCELDRQLLEPEPSMFEPEYDDWLCSVKTALFFQDWIDEKDEEYLLEHYDVRPGELHAKLEKADWLLYAFYEICRIQQRPELLADVTKARVRLKYGAKEELLQLLKLEGIGRVRARKLFRAGIKTLEDVRNSKADFLVKVLGSVVAQSIKRQVGAKELKTQSLEEFSNEKI